MKKFLTILVVALIFSAGSASAHVLIKDATGAKGAILHIQPDDDPIAGERATLYFDMQSESNSTVQLTIKNDKTAEKITLEPVAVKGSLATIAYTFPAQGTFGLTFEVASGSSIHTFTTHQRVSRGVVAGDTTAKTHVWAEMLLLGSSIGVAILVITFVRQRKMIGSASKLSK